MTKRRSPWTAVQPQSPNLSEATDRSRGDQEGSNTGGEGDWESEELEKQMKRVGSRWGDPLQA